jgi:hypothetical protein
MKLLAAREAYYRRRRERAADIKQAIDRAKRGEPHLLLELIKDDDLREAIGAAGLLPCRKKRGRPSTPLRAEARDIHRMLERQRRAFGRVRYGDIPRLAQLRVHAMIRDGELSPDSDVAGVVSDLIAIIYKKWHVKRSR